MSLFGKPAKELLYDLIVAQNPGLTDKGVTIDKMLFGVPSHITANDPDTEQYTRINTTLDISGIIEKDTFGKFTATYRRLDVAHLFENVVLSVDGSGATTAADLIPLLQAKYNWMVDATEIYASDSLTSPEKHSLRFNGSSFAWIGTVDVYLTELPSDGVDLSKLVTVTELNGLVYDTSGMTQA